MGGSSSACQGRQAARFMYASMPTRMRFGEANPLPESISKALAALLADLAGAQAAEGPL